MAEPVLEATPDTYLSFSSEFDSIAISPPPPFDQAPLLGNSISDLRFFIDGDFQLTLEDSVDDLYLPSETQSFFGEMSCDFTPASGDCVNEYAEKDTNGVLVSTSSCYDRQPPKDSDCSVTIQSLSLSTLDSANCVSHILQATNASSSPISVEEEAATTSVTTKRKKEISEDTTEEELRNYKFRRLDQDGFAGGGEEADERRNVRLIRNRESAHLSRQRKRRYVEELQDKVKNMHSTITDLNSKMSYFMAENVTLRHQVGSRMSLHPRPGMYPVPYPWMQCPAYMVKPQGSQVALLPIPRLKPQQSVAKVNKVASFSVLGLLFCLFLFGSLAPIVNVSYGEYKSNYVTDRVYDESRGRVLDVNRPLDVSVTSNRAHCGRYSDQEKGRNVSATENSGPRGNTSEPLAASLFVPRNEKLVKIDGNLIIHSSLAREKAMASETNNQGGKSDEATTNKGIFPALPLPRTGDMVKHILREKRKALSSSGSDDASEDQLKSATANGKMQQWFREGVSGPMFSSGMCTDVFQFDVSTTSGAIIPASTPIQQSENTTDTHKGKRNRRILRGGLPVPDFNLTKDHNSSSNENFRDTKPSPSMVVSVLVDPREGGDGDIDGMMEGTKSRSRVFIVLLVDGVKYVTYSCVLPQPEITHLVTT